MKFPMVVVLSFQFVQITKSAENFALNRPAYQSGTGHGGVAERAVDGSTDTHYFTGLSCTLTSNGYVGLNWWAVDLQRPRKVTSFKITNRHDNYVYRLRDFNVRVGYQNSSDAENTLCYFYEGQVPAGATEHLECYQPIFGRYVFIKKVTPNEDALHRVLTLCEMQVLGEEFLPRTSASSPVPMGYVYRGPQTFSVGEVRSVLDCTFRCQQHMGCITYVVTRLTSGVYLCEINDSEDTSLQQTNSSISYFFEPQG